MRIRVRFKNSILIDYINIKKDHNKIPKTFEILSTRLGCPKCNSDSMTDRYGYQPSIDSFCCINSCHHSIEVKSILAEGSQSSGFTANKPIKVKLGSPNTYKSVNKNNKTLMLFWYNILYQDDMFVDIEMKDCVSVLMSTLLVGKNCSLEKVLQKKKTKYKERLNLQIFPELCILKVFKNIDFKHNTSIWTKRQLNVIMNTIVNKKFRNRQRKIIPSVFLNKLSSYVSVSKLNKNTNKKTNKKILNKLRTEQRNHKNSICLVC